MSKPKSFDTWTPDEQEAWKIRRRETVRKSVEKWKQEDPEGYLNYCRTKNAQRKLRDPVGTAERQAERSKKHTDKLKSENAEEYQRRLQALKDWVAKMKMQDPEGFAKIQAASSAKYRAKMWEKDPNGFAAKTQNQSLKLTTKRRDKRLMLQTASQFAQTCEALKGLIEFHQNKP